MAAIASAAGWRSIAPAGTDGANRPHGRGAALNGEQRGERCAAPNAEITVFPWKDPAPSTVPIRQDRGRSSLSVEGEREGAEAHPSPDQSCVLHRVPCSIVTMVDAVKGALKGIQ
jgi:hypothetical protein